MSTPVAGGGQPSSCSDFNSGHFNTSVKGEHSTDVNKDELKSVCVLKSLVVWGEGRERQSGEMGARTTL